MLTLDAEACFCYIYWVPAKLINQMFLCIDSGFLIDNGHYVRMGDPIRCRAIKSGLKFKHFFNSYIPAEIAPANRLECKFRFLDVKRAGEKR